MASGWHKVAQVFQMDWDEVKTRVAQELDKRRDFARYKLGLKPAAIGIGLGLAEGDFFFRRSQAGERALLVQEALPDQARDIVREADEACEHRFRLLGYDDLDFGPEIDWHLDQVHNKRAPLDPWFKIPFLNFSVVGDHKVIWELNRHEHLVTLAKAWLLTHDGKYVHELMAQWHSWTKANPYPLGINWGSSLEVAFRSLSWIWVDHLISDAPGYAEFRAQLLPALAFHGRYIERYLSTYFSPNTHLLGETVALFFLGTLYPQMPGASRWQKSGWETVIREAKRQVRTDGVYFEQSLYYHVYALDFFLHARQLTVANDLPISPAYDATLLKMLDLVEALAQAGPPEGFGDDDGGRLFDPRRNRTEHMIDPLSLGALAFRREGLLAARLTEEAIWLFGERAIRELRKPVLREVKSVAFPDGGIYVIADSMPCTQTMMLDAGPQGVGRCGHGHADALSMRLTMNGRRWLIDSGSGAYVSSDSRERNLFRGTAAHNTVQIDGLDQAIASEPFAWSDVPSTKAERWALGKTFTFFCGSHDGYERMVDPVIHHRSILRVNARDDEGLWLIRDVLLGDTQHELEQNWHFAPEISTERVSDFEFAVSMAEADQPRLRIIIPARSVWKSETQKARVSPAYGRYETAQVLRFRAQIKLPAESGTVMITEAVNTLPRHEWQLSSTELPLVQVYELRDQYYRHEFFFARSKQLWSFGPWSADAEAVYCRIESERITQLIVIAASEVAWAEEPLFKTSDRFQFFEWRSSDDVKNAEPASVTTTPHFDVLTQRRNVTSDSATSTHSYEEKR